MLAVGAAVIGGTSLFGGHGRVIDAVLGGLVVAVIINGMSDLIRGANSSGCVYGVTGAVLLLDAVARRARPASGPVATAAREVLSSHRATGRLASPMNPLTAARRIHPSPVSPGYG